MASSFLFPPIALIILLVILLASLGKSLGLREIYVRTLIRIFEWGARQIRTEVKKEGRKRKESHAPLPALPLDSSNSDEDDDAKTAAASDGYESACSRRRRNSGTSTSSRTSHGSLRRHGSGNHIIHRDTQLHFDDDDESSKRFAVSSTAWAIIHDSADFIKNGIESIIEDEVTSRFEAEQLVSWNMLTRTSIRFYHFVNWKLTALWVAGFLFRYVLMLPLRAALFMIGLSFMLVSTAAIGIIPDGPRKRSLNESCMLACHRILSRSLCAVVHFHDRQFAAKNGGIAVANHTSPLDVTMLSTDNVYALIGQRQGGLLGLIQRALSRASAHIWFERSEAKDRSAVTSMLREHTSNPNKLPILIFPEGTCINNTSVMMFKKGSFEVGTTIYPIAMKYDSRFGDAFWNSAEQSWGEYIMRLMTSWAIICNVYYLPPMTKRANEDAIEFASRVKKAIAQKGGLVDLEWDGALKRSRVPPALIARQQEKYYNRLARYTSTSDGMQIAEGEQDDEGISASPLFCHSRQQLPEEAGDSCAEGDSQMEDERRGRRTENGEEA